MFKSFMILTLLGLLPLSTIYGQVPSVVSGSPTQNELNVSVSTDISVTFDTDMDETTIHSSSFVVHGRSTGLHQGSITYDSPTKTATLDPQHDFMEGETVTAVLTTDIESSGGIPLASSYIWSFTVKSGDGPGLYGPHNTYAAGGHPYWIISADVDNDNDLDIVNTNFVSNTVSVHLGNGDGTFATDVQYSVGLGPSSVFAVDVDRDLDIDLVTACFGSNQIWVLLNDGTGVFLPDTSYSSGNGTRPISVVAADIDGDGYPDLATANHESDDVLVWFNNDDGTFALDSYYPAGDHPYHICAADLDGDADLDLAIANALSSDASVLLNNGDGTFAPQITYAAGENPSSITADDLDDDGDLDLSMATWKYDKVSILYGNGDGTFAPYVTYDCGNAAQVTVADLDGDGNLDMATANTGDNASAVLMNNGDGTFAPRVEYPVGENPRSVVAADFDGDGDLDLAVTNAHSDSVSVLINEIKLVVQPDTLWFFDYEDGADPPNQTIDIEASEGSIAFAVTDDADWLDVSPDTGNTPVAATASVSVAGLAGGDHTATISVSSEDADNSPQTVCAMLRLYPIGTPQVVSMLPVRNSVDAPLSTNISITFDVDMDASSINDTTLIVIASSTGQHHGTIGYDSPSMTATIDPDEDFDEGEVVTVVLTEHIESAAGLPLSRPYIWSFTTAASGGTGIFGTHTLYPVGEYPYWITAADLDDDDDLDLAVANYLSDFVSIMLNDGNGNFSHTGYAVAGGPTSVVAADLDRDGDLDLATTAYGPNLVSILLNDGDATFAPYSSYACEDGQNPISVFAADIDGDGDTDLATANNGSSNVSVLQNNGDATFAAHSTHEVDGEPYSVHAADLDSDGDLDLVTANAASATASVLMNNGLGNFAPQISYAIDPEPSCVVAADIDRDGDLDLTFTTWEYDMVSILSNNGDGTFAPYATYSSGNSASLSAADLDDDGYLDLATANAGTDNSSVMLNDGTGAFPARTEYATGEFPKSVCCSDLDGDGDLDLALANAGANNISILFNVDVIICGDPDLSGEVELEDVVYLLGYIFSGGQEPLPYSTGDVNCSGSVDIDDAVYLIAFLFTGGFAPCDIDGDGTPDC